MPNRYDEKPPDKDGKFEGRTYLYIRTNPADTGTEPLPSTLKHWKSPDIVIIKPDSTRGAEAVANQQNQVEVTVSNTGGIDAIDAYIESFVADPSTAFTPATATFIGGGYLTIPGYNMRNITFPWTPASVDEGHRCLLSRVALFIPSDTYTDGTIFDVRNDRHVAQRNIHVVNMGKDNMIRFGFAIINPLEKSMSMRILTQELREPIRQQQLGMAMGCALVQFGETPLKNFKVDVGSEKIVVPNMQDVRENLKPTEFRLRSIGQLSPVSLSRPQTRLSMEMGAREVRQGFLCVERNPETRSGDVHAVDITQTGENGNIVGGLTVVVRH